MLVRTGRTARGHRRQMSIELGELRASVRNGVLERGCALRFALAHDDRRDVEIAPRQHLQRVSVWLSVPR